MIVTYQSDITQLHDHAYYTIYKTLFFFRIAALKYRTIIVMYAGMYVGHQFVIRHCCGSSHCCLRILKAKLNIFHTWYMDSKWY